MSGAASANERVRRGYDRFAATYERLAALLSAGAIPRSRRRLLPDVVGCRRALIPGGGPGASLCALLDAGFEGHIVHLDLAPAMQAAARRALQRRHPAAAQQVQWVCAGIDEATALPTVDLICTHYFLDQFEGARLDSIVQALATRLEPGGFWHEVDFAAPRSLGRAAVAQRMLLGALYTAFGSLCGLEARERPPIGSTIERHGLRLERREGGAGGILRTAIYRRPKASVGRSTRSRTGAPPLTPS